MFINEDYLILIDKIAIKLEINMYTPPIKSLIKLGRFDGSLARVVEGLGENSGLFPIESGYAMFGKTAKRPYLLMVQHSDEISSCGHNAGLTVTSRYNRVNQNVLKQFQKRIGINFDIEIPRNFRMWFEGNHVMVLEAFFRAFEGNPNPQSLIERLKPLKIV